MTMKARIFAACFVAAGFIACGGGADVESYDCGEGTVEQDGECIPDVAECDDGEVHDQQLNRCVRAADDYCGDGTEFDADSGQCVGLEFQCDPDTTGEEDGECVPDPVVACGQGTVAADGQCRFEEDVCGDNTELDEDACQPAEGACGEGTAFDVSTRQCIPVDDLECGAGTHSYDGECIAESAFLEQLSEDAEIVLSEDVTDVDLPDQGEQLVFTGTIEAPDTVDGELVAHRDVMEFSAGQGEWLEITVYSMGLPMPGFRLHHTAGDVQLERFSDYITGISSQRKVLISADGAHQLEISNLPQLLGQSPVGGQDWDYVGVIEQVDAPAGTDINLTEDPIEGDIRQLATNYYSVQLNDARSVAVTMDVLPEDADGELQVWADETTHDTSYPMEGDVVVFEPPSDQFYLVLDRVHASGPNTDFSVTARQGQSASSGETITADVDVEPGDYVGLFQYNDRGEALDATIAAGDDTLKSDTLGVSTAGHWPLALYHYAGDTDTVTLEVTNSSGEALDFLAIDAVTGTADEIDNFDGTFVAMDYQRVLTRGQRHFYELEVAFNGAGQCQLKDADADGLVQLYQDGQLQEEDINTVTHDVEPGDYLLVVEALGTMADGFTLECEG